MTLRHATALALVGWYLMMPPHVGGDGKPDKGVPLAQWDQMGSYDSAAECSGAYIWFLKQRQKESALSLRSNPPPLTLQADAARQQLGEASAAVCIASDDPRLKEH